MKPLYHKICFSAFGCMLLLASCSKNNGGVSDTKTTNTTAKAASVPYYAKAINLNSLSSTSAASNIHTNSTSKDSVYMTWTSANIYIDEITFDATLNGTAVSKKISIQKNVDILSGEALAGAIDLDPGAYKNVKVALHLKKVSSSDPAAPYMAFNINGTFKDAARKTVDYHMGCSVEFDVKLAVSDVNIIENGQYRVTVSYDFSKLLSGISYADANGGYHWPDGSTGVSSSVNIPMYNKVLANWQTLASATIQ